MSELIEQRAKRKDISFNDIMQADFILFLRSELNDKINYIYRWFPHSLVYSITRSAKFEKFLRSESTKYFNKFKIVLGVNNIDEFKELIKDFRDGKRKAPTWQHESIDPGYLANIDKLATKP